MTKILINLSRSEDKFLNIYKAIFGFKTKELALKDIVKKAEIAEEEKAKLSRWKK